MGAGGRLGLGAAQPNRAPCGALARGADSGLQVLNSLGENVSTMEAEALIADVDLDNSGAIEFNEFLQVRLPRCAP